MKKETDNYIKVVKVRQSSNSVIATSFEVSKNLKRFFVSYNFQTEYSVNIGFVPYSLGVIPFVCNILPLVWLTNSILVVDELDEDFYNNIAGMRSGYSQMYPSLCWNGSIKVSKVVKNKSLANRDLAFFSGGVDAFATLFAHMDKKPILFTIWGADVATDDIVSWNNVLSHVQSIANEYDLQSITCKTNFRSFINCSALDDFIHQDLEINDSWWHGIQHSIGSIAHAAPLSILYNLRFVYFGSSYTIRERDIFTIASDPRIDEQVSFNGCKVIHDQFEYNRQQKIRNIVNYLHHVNGKVFLRVCWQVNSNGKNCCKCEKCKRTIYGLLAEGENPNDYGFYVSKIDLWKIRFQLKYLMEYTPNNIMFWQDIQRRCCEEMYPPFSSICWIIRYDFVRSHSTFWNRAVRKMYKYIKKVL